MYIITTADNKLNIVNLIFDALFTSVFQKLGDFIIKHIDDWYIRDKILTDMKKMSLLFTRQRIDLSRFTFNETTKDELETIVGLITQKYKGQTNVLLHGPPGGGKTSFMQYIYHVSKKTYGNKVFVLFLPGSFFKQYDKKDATGVLRGIMELVIDNMKNGIFTLICFDEVETFLNASEKNIDNLSLFISLLQQLDNFRESEENKASYVFLCSTNKLEMIDAEIRNKLAFVIGILNLNLEQKELVINTYIEQMKKKYPKQKVNIDLLFINNLTNQFGDLMPGDIKNLVSLAFAYMDLHKKSVNNLVLYYFFMLEIKKYKILTKKLSEELLKKEMQSYLDDFNALKNLYIDNCDNTIEFLKSPIPTTTEDTDS